VTVASNLPEGDAAGSGDSTNQQSETRERTTFDVSETQREIAREPGDIRRISVAVLINGLRVVGEDGVARISPRPEEEIAALSALVQSSIGYDASRGDTVTLQSMAFDDSVTGSLAEPGFADRLSLDLGRVLQTLVLAAAALFIAFGLLRPLLRREPGLLASAQTTDAALPAMAGAIPGAQAALALSSPAPGTAPQAAADRPGENDTLLPAIAQAAAPDAPDPPEDIDPVERLRRMIEEREEETVEILRGWMEQDEGARP
jgi:flagellar M-ring protein FliF